MPQIANHAYTCGTYFTLSLTNKCIFSDKVRLPVRNEMEYIDK